MAYVVLKPKHSLVGKSLLSLILETQSGEEPTELARLKDYPLEHYNLDELCSEFLKLTGETARSVLKAVGKGETEDAMRRLMHFAILAANSYGLPRGQVLTDSAPGPSSSGSGSSSSGTSSSSAASGVLTPPRTSTASSVDGTTLEARIKTMEQSVSDLKTKTDQNVVKDALRQVRILASRPKLTQTHVLLASLENLVDVARQASHKDADFYSKALSACRRYDEHDDICGLCLKLLGSNEDKKISSAIAEWVKGKKYEQETSEPKIKCKDSKQNLPSQSVLPAYPYGFPGFPPASYPYPVPPMQFGSYGGQGYPRYRMRRPQSSNFPPKTCNACKQTGHFLADCPKLKKD